MRLLLVLWLCVSAVAWAQELEMKNDGAVLSTYTLEQLKAMVPEQSVEMVGHDGQRRTYRAFPLPALLQQVYGDRLKGVKDLLFVCDDGYASNVNASEILRYEGWLAFGFADGSPFKTDHDLGPFMLVWDTQKFPRQKTLGSLPYQVAALDLVDFGKRYSKVLPPAGSRPEVQRGFQAFRHACLSCHKVNGQGGDRAVDLNWPVSVTRYIREPYLARIIDAPTKVRGNATMPGLLPNYPDRARTIQDIVAYLKAMSQPVDQKRSGR